jgi:hypothetical protein
MTLSYLPVYRNVKNTGFLITGTSVPVCHSRISIAENPTRSLSDTGTGILLVVNSYKKSTGTVQIWHKYSKQYFYRY